MPKIAGPVDGRSYEPTPVVAALYDRTSGAINRGLKKNCDYYVADHEGHSRTYWWDMQHVRAYMPYMKRPVRSR